MARGDKQRASMVSPRCGRGWDQRIRYRMQRWGNPDEYASTADDYAATDGCANQHTFTKGDRDGGGNGNEHAGTERI